MYFLFPELRDGVTFDHIDEVIDRAIIMHQDISVMDLILRQNILDYLLVQMGQGFGTVEFHASQFGRSNGDLRWTFIQTNANLLQFSADLHSMLFCLSCLQHHQDHVWILCHCDHLLSSTLAIRCALDDSRKIEELDLGVVVVDDSGDAGQCSKLVGCGEGSCVCDAGEEGGFTDWGEADHANPSITESADLKALALASLGARL